MILANLKEEKRLWKNGFRVLAGADESGRGALAGPVVGAVFCIKDLQRFLRSPEAADIVRLVRDSKALTPRRREAIFKVLKAPLFFEISVSRVGPEEIDRINVRIAALKAMKTAVYRLSPRPDALLVDGTDIIPIRSALQLRQYTYIKGDARIFLISAASIAAKVTRDRLMTRLAGKYPRYGFEIHKGYGTRLHRARIKKLGASCIHRKTFRLY